MTYTDVKQIIWMKMKQASHRSVPARLICIVLVAVYLLCLHLYKNIRKQVTHPKRVVAMMLAMLLAFPNPYLVRADQLVPVEEPEAAETAGTEPEATDVPTEPETTEEAGTEPETTDVPIDPNAYNLSIVVTAPDENLDYPETFVPMVDIRVTNTGNEPLTGLSVAAEGFDLWYALDPLAEYLPWNFVPGEEPNIEEEPNMGEEPNIEEELTQNDPIEEAVKEDDHSLEQTDEESVDVDIQPQPSPEIVPDSGNSPTTEPDSGNSPTTEPDSGSDPTSEPDSGSDPTSEPDLGNDPTSEPETTPNNEVIPEVVGGEVPQAEPSEELLEIAEFVGVSFDNFNLPDTLEPGASIYFRTQLSDEFTMKMLVEAFSLKVAEIEEAYVLPYVYEEEYSAKEEEQTPEELPTEELPTEGENLENQTPEINNSFVQVLNRAGGYSMGDTFFAMGEACYFVAVDESLTEVEYCLGSVSGVATVENGVATIPIPDDVNGRLQVFYRDENGEQQVAVEEYVVNETDAPRVVFERVETEEASYVHVTLVEKGEIKSGIREYAVVMDDELITVDSQMVQKSISLVSGQSVPTVIEFDLPLIGTEEHEFDITVQDYVGNARHKCFTMSALESEVVSVVLPTTFEVLVLPDNEQYQVIGEDFYVQNRSGFPVTISLDHSSVSIDPEIPEMILSNQVIELGNDAGEIYHLQAPDTDMEKRCDLSLNLIRANEPEVSYLLPEGHAYDVMSFDLQASEGTEELTMQSQGYEASRALTPDMAILNVRGVVARGTEHLWRENDLKIKMVFHFVKSDELDEKLTKEELEALEKERLEMERLEQERLEQERLEQERLEQERLEQERLEQERLEQEGLGQEGLGQEGLGQEGLGQEGLQQEEPGQEGLEQEGPGQEGLEQKPLEQEEPEQKAPEQENPTQEPSEQEKLEQEGESNNPPSVNDQESGDKTPVDETVVGEPTNDKTPGEDIPNQETQNPESEPVTQEEPKQEEPSTPDSAETPSSESEPSADVPASNETPAPTPTEGDKPKENA